MLPCACVRFWTSSRFFSLLSDVLQQAGIAVVTTWFTLLVIFKAYAILGFAVCKRINILQPWHIIASTKTLVGAHNQLLGLLIKDQKGWTMTGYPQNVLSVLLLRRITCCAQAALEQGSLARLPSLEGHQSLSDCQWLRLVTTAEWLWCHHGLGGEVVIVMIIHVSSCRL